MPQAKLDDDHLERIRTQVLCGPEAPSYTTTYNAADTFDSMGIDNAHNFDEWEERMNIEIVSMDERDMVFDLVGVDVSIANALRRILIAEVPTMAIEKVFIMNNTSIIQDEVLAHRLGLIPVNADPERFKFKKSDDDATEDNTLVFRLEVKCRSQPAETASGGQPSGMVHDKVVSGDMKWLPHGKQEKVFAQNRPAPVDSDILIAKMRPGQTIDLEAHCVKGIGSDHAKWSPVATASYRLLPIVDLLEDITDDDAVELKSSCAPGVFDIEDLADGTQRATVANARKCTLCRECVRENRFPEKIRLGRQKDHFIFSIESTGAMRPQRLFTEALSILENKFRNLSAFFEQQQQEAQPADGA